METATEIEFGKYTKKSWLKSCLLGFLIGLAVIVPGISGSTVAIIFRLYDKMICAFGNLFKAFKKCFVFLLPIAVGLVVGLLVGFVAVKKLIDLLPFAIVCLFAGLMAGAFPAVKDEIKGEERTAGRWALFFVGILIPVIISVCSVFLSAKGVSLFENITVWKVLLAVVVGYVLGITQIVPGLSASAFLMAIGWFSALLDGASFSNLLFHLPLLIYLGLGVGFLLGILTFSSVLNKVFACFRGTAYFMIVGLSLGSILTMFFNADIFGVYVSWVEQGVNFTDFALGVALAIIGFIASYRLVVFERKKKADETETK